MSTENVKSAKEKLDPIVLRIAIVLVVGALAPLFDSTIVNVAIHTIAVDLKTTISIVQWITTGYVLAMGLVVPISGWATKRFGGKRLYIFSLVFFLIGSVCSMLSWNIESMIVFRIIQGIGAGLMMPCFQHSSDIQWHHYKRGVTDVTALLPGGARCKRPVSWLAAASSRHRYAAH